MTWWWYAARAASSAAISSAISCGRVTGASAPWTSSHSSEWYQRFPEAENLCLDLQLKESCETAVRGAAEVYNLAADMGGMGFIENNRASACCRC